jgi:hypothetical protein
MSSRRSLTAAPVAWSRRSARSRERAGDRGQLRRLPARAVTKKRAAQPSEQREALCAGALAVLTPWPAAGSTLTVLQLLLGPTNAACSCRRLLGILDPADELVPGQGCDVLPGIEGREVGDQRLPEICGKHVHHPTGHSRGAHRAHGSGRTGSAPEAPLAVVFSAAAEDGDVGLYPTGLVATGPATGAPLSPGEDRRHRQAAPLLLRMGSAEIKDRACQIRAICSRKQVARADTEGHEQTRIYGRLPGDSCADRGRRSPPDAFSLRLKSARSPDRRRSRPPESVLRPHPGNVGSVEIR